MRGESAGADSLGSSAGAELLGLGRLRLPDPAMLATVPRLGRRGLNVDAVARTRWTALYLSVRP